MAGEADDASWLDLSTDVAAAKAAPAEAPAADDWLIEDPNAGKVTQAFRHLVDSCMRGTNRVMACDGQFLAYRPFNREFDKETNPRTKERMNMFREQGLYKHLGTYDEVEIYELLDGNPYKHVAKSYVVGQNYWADIRKAAAAALHRAWADYHDLLGAMATAIKSGREPIFAKTMWEDTINQVGVAIKQMGGKDAPTEKEINTGFLEVRRSRGITGRNGVILLDSNRLQQVEFTKGGK